MQQDTKYIYCSNIIIKLLLSYKSFGLGIEVRLSFYHYINIFCKLYRAKLAILFYFLHNKITNLTLK